MKKTILMLSDHPLAPSGVGIQARYLINGLVNTGRYSFRCLGGAVKHDDYRTIKVNDDFIIKPIDGFGNPDIIRTALVNEKPDAVLLFTDPRFFTWLWNIEEEIHQICPILYWHVWDNDPYPEFNEPYYKSNELINCISRKTYDLVSSKFPDRANYIPHAIPPGIFHPVTEIQKQDLRKSMLGISDPNHFVLLWVNRNARRKMPGNVIAAWSEFNKALKEKYPDAAATLVMHTDPYDGEGQNLVVVADKLKAPNVIFSTSKLEFQTMNALHNASDACINISANEGFGLATLEAMQVGNPIIALKTGGLTDQIIDYRDGSANGVALDVDARDLIGSQTVPYIYEDHVSIDKVAKSMMQMFELGPNGRKNLGKKAREYAKTAFNYDQVIQKWDESIMNTLDKWNNQKHEFNQMVTL